MSNAQVHPPATPDPEQNATASRGSGATLCSVASVGSDNQEQLYTKDEVVERIKTWVESHNLEFDWDWNDLNNVRKEMIECARVSGTCEIQDLLNHFTCST